MLDITKTLSLISKTGVKMKKIAKVNDINKMSSLNLLVEFFIHFILA